MGDCCAKPGTIRLTFIKITLAFMLRIDRLLRGKCKNKNTLQEAVEIIQPRDVMP
jgi:hypothetical protein